MRVSIILLATIVFWGLFLNTLLSGVWLALALFLWALICVISVFYIDTAVLFYLGARELRSDDEPAFFKAAAQESYKLAVPMPDLYFYNGSLERGFILQKRKKLSLVLSKSLLQDYTDEELSAICFELLLQAKKKMASKRTKALFLIGTSSWMVHFIIGAFLKIVHIREVHYAFFWMIHYLMQPCLELVFKITLGKSYFKKLETFLKDYPEEEQTFSQVGLKLRPHPGISSLPSKKLVELSSITKSPHFQNILSLEFLPHEWDILFTKDLTSAA